MNNFNNPGLEGNPHFIDVTCQASLFAQLVSSNLAVAYEQRTANMIALFNSSETDLLDVPQYKALRESIVKRTILQIKEG